MRWWCIVMSQHPNEQVSPAQSAYNFKRCRAVETVGTVLPWGPIIFTFLYFRMHRCIFLLRGYSRTYIFEKLSHFFAILLWALTFMITIFKKRTVSFFVGVKRTEFVFVGVTQSERYRLIYNSSLNQSEDTLKKGAHVHRAKNYFLFSIWRTSSESVFPTDSVKSA